MKEWFSKIKKEAVLSEEELVELILKKKQGLTTLDEEGDIFLGIEEIVSSHPMVSEEIARKLESTITELIHDISVWIFEKEIDKFDPYKGSLKTFISYKVRGYILNKLRILKKRPKLISIYESLEEQLFGREEGLPLEEILVKEGPTEIEETEFYLTLEKFLDYLRAIDPMYETFVSMRLEGYTDEEISRALDVDKFHLRIIRDKIFPIFKNFFGYPLD
jgi:DNA-directed RNA polymerase specialized sigma24 family protein